MIWTILWVLWVAAFAVIEGVALAHDHIDHLGGTGEDGSTLSQHLRRWFRTDTHRGRTAWLVSSGVFLAWFVVHIAVAGAA